MENRAVYRVHTVNMYAHCQSLIYSRNNIELLSNDNNFNTKNVFSCVCIQKKFWSRNYYIFDYV